MRKAKNLVITLLTLLAAPMSFGQTQQGIPVEGLINGRLIFNYQPIRNLVDGKWQLVAVLPQEGSTLTSGLDSKTNEISVTLIMRMDPPEQELYNKYNVAQPFIPLAGVKRPEDVIVHGADITPSEESAYVALILNQTKANVVARMTADKLSLGVGTTLSLLLLKDSNEVKAKSLLGFPGSEITLQPGTGVTWKGVELFPGGKTAATFKFGFKEGTTIISEIKSGELKFSRKDSSGNTVDGTLVQTEKGVVEHTSAEANKTVTVLPAAKAKPSTQLSSRPRSSQIPEASTIPESAVKTLTNQDVIDLAKDGLNEANLINTIKESSNVLFDLSPEGQRNLLKNGISNNIIAAMRVRQAAKQRQSPQPRNKKKP